MDIKITITNKHCTVQGAPAIVCGNSGYTMTFTFDAEWDQAAKKTARFSYVRDGQRRRHDVELTGNSVKVPAVYRTRELQVGVYAGDLVTSTPARIPCEKSIVCDSCEPDDLFPGQVNRIVHDLIDKTCPSFTESGEVVTCSPVEDHPLEVVSHITPTQKGSGDPSPSNIRPIIGYDSITLSHTGRNLFGGEALADVLLAVGCTKDAENGIITIEPGNCDRTTPFFANFKENTQYTFIFYGRNTNANLALNHLNLCIRYTDGEEAEVWGNAPGTDQYVVVTSKAGKTVYGVQVTWYNGNTILYYDKCGVFEGDVGLEAFEPYKGDTFTIDIGQTVYGGTFNWQTGALTISYTSIVLDGTTSGKKVTSTDPNALHYAFSPPVTPPKKGAPAYGDRTQCELPISAPVLEVEMATEISGATEGDSASTVVAKINAVLKSWYDAGTPLTCVYEVETPTIIQLTPQEILALSGTNYISSNTGDTEVTGKVYPGAIIADLYDKINKLQAAAVNNA